MRRILYVILNLSPSAVSKLLQRGRMDELKEKLVGAFFRGVWIKALVEKKQKIQLVTIVPHYGKPVHEMI